MEQYYSTRRPAAQARERERAIVANPHQQHALARGLVNGILLSVIMWITAGYLTFILR